MKKLLLFFVFVMPVFMLIFSSTSAFSSTEDVMTVAKQYKKFAPVKISIKAGLLNVRQHKVVSELVKAADCMDDLFMQQVYSGNANLMAKLSKLKGKDRVIYKYFRLNYGPFDRLEHDTPFVKGIEEKPLGANFYPEDMTKKEFTSWIRKHPADKDMFEGNFTVIKRKGKNLVAVPYSTEYRELLEKAAEHLRKAAKYADNASLKKYLLSRADAFLSNDYYQSDVDWVHLKNHAIEVVIGPYEVYEDGLFGYKAAFEAFITRVDPKESKRLAKVVAFLDKLEDHLPIAEKYKGKGRSLRSPIVVAQEIYTAGDTRAGVQTLAFNLPNDEKVRKQEGSKKVLLKNVQDAKFKKILIPIAKKIFSPADASKVNFEAFFAHTLLHEVSHGIGPGQIRKGRRMTTVNRELRDYYSTIEEAKADTLGVYNAVYLMGKGLYPKGFDSVMWPTYLASIFRSVRFGIGEAHGGANAVQFNYLLEKGAVKYDSKTKLFSIDEALMPKAIKALAHDILMIEAKGDYRAAKLFVHKYRKIPECLKVALKNLKSVPVDINPRYNWGRRR